MTEYGSIFVNIYKLYITQYCNLYMYNHTVEHVRGEPTLVSGVLVMRIKLRTQRNVPSVPLLNFEVA